MAKNLKLDDFAELALGIKPILDAHEVPQEFHYSIISDVVFEFANLLDTRTGTSFHESIYPLLEDQIDALSAGATAQGFHTDVKIVFGNGDVSETNFSRHQLDDDEDLRRSLEFDLRLRDIDEIDAEVDIAPRFDKLVAGKQGIREVQVLPGNEADADAWRTVAEFERSIDGLMDCIRNAAGQC